MGRKLYVGNISFDVNDETLTALFRDHGTVESAKVIMDRETGRSKGFGFVEMTTDEEAKAATDALDGTENNGRALKVSEAKPQTDRDRFGGGSRRHN